MQRCDDLIEICEGRKQFILSTCFTKSDTNMNFKGTNGMSIEQSLSDIKLEFQIQIDRLRNLPYDILDVRDSQWHEDYNTFKCGLKVMCHIKVLNSLH